MISEAVTTQISKLTFSHSCSKFLAIAKVGLAHYDSFLGLCFLLLFVFFRGGGGAGRGEVACAFVFLFVYACLYDAALPVPSLTHRSMSTNVVPS